MLMGTMKAAAGFLGLTAVALGAFGAHGLKAGLAARGMTEAWNTGAQYHLVHALALLALAAFSTNVALHNARWLSRAAWSWIIGVTLFSGSLYAMGLGAPRQIGAITPLGGIALIVGWACLLVPFRNRGNASEN
jgi:uncharacterized membrane protein YgdD (TMEM256/DUF423 family)